MNPRRLIIGACLLPWLAGCVNSTVDQMVFNTPGEGIGDASVVILGRRHASDYETEPDFISCVGSHISSRDESISVIGELEFLNALYPWFEPRTAPLRPADLERLLEHKDVADTFATLQTQYMIWIDGSTVRNDSAGSMTCGIGPGGAGCFGFGTWSNDANYEATIWDFSNRAEVGRISTTASGQSYMPAVVVPIPIIAPVQGTACDSIGDQLLEFLSEHY
ncbi:hypothetical protein Q6D67_12995 [Haliea sp. E1-2-M8]|uniref:hypothetical protein n=1 Tax=Haliea sp. E1-2-M8 TaxID=3064706 RepID=UPI00272284E9|nr:hypothetical protein [Haliea sp. E1-2-M8]MDO8862620.1 hypothetical protein [Haliea sp. E1-2-M8]